MPIRERKPRESREARALREKEKSIEEWVPKTELGKKVKNGEISSIEEIDKINVKIMK